MLLSKRNCVLTLILRSRYMYLENTIDTGIEKQTQCALARMILVINEPMEFRF